MQKNTTNKEMEEMEWWEKYIEEGGGLAQWQNLSCNGKKLKESEFNNFCGSITNPTRSSIINKQLIN